jgi:hypothetical protein
MKTNDFSRYPTAQILADWRRFIRSGLRATALTPTLAQHLAGYCDFGHLLSPSPEALWQATIGQDTFLMGRFLNQFGGNHPSIYSQDRAWLDEGPAACLNQKMCAELKALYRPLLKAISTYETWAHRKYNDMFHRGVPVREALHRMLVEAAPSVDRRVIHQPILFQRRGVRPRLPLRAYDTVIRRPSIHFHSNALRSRQQPLPGQCAPEKERGTLHE